MRRRQPARVDASDAPTLSVRAVRFEEVPEILRLIEGAIERGCRNHYDRAQRRAVFLVYASNLFVDAVGSFQTVAAEIGGQLAAVAQLDVGAGALRALFVDAAAQGQGVGRALLAAVEARARAAGCARLRGAMSLNAVPFYAHAGFLPCGGPARLLSAGLRVPVTWMEKSLRASRPPSSPART
jgi:GNAT superfamily N-acetyltransferase